MDIALIAQTAELAKPDQPGAAGIDAEALRGFARTAEEAGFAAVSVAGLVAGQDVAAVASFILHSTTGLGVFLKHRIGAVPPTIAAQHLAMLDQLSGGRVNVAFEPDRGESLASQEEQLARVDEYLVLLKRLWSNTRPFDHEGTYYRLAGAFSAAKPCQKPHIPLSLGGLSGTAVNIAGRHADIFDLPQASEDETRQTIARVKAAAACHRRADAIRFSHPLAWTGAGPEQTALALLGLRDLGVTDILVHGLRDPEALRWFGAHVLPLVRRALERQDLHRQPQGGAPAGFGEAASRAWQ